MITMALCAVIGFAVPVAIAWWMAKKYKNSLYTILVGAGVFIVFALLLEPILHQVVLKGPHGPAIMGNTAKAENRMLCFIIPFSRTGSDWFFA